MKSLTFFAVISLLHIGNSASYQFHNKIYQAYLSKVSEVENATKGSHRIKAVNSNTDGISAHAIEIETGDLSSKQYQLSSMDMIENKFYEISSKYAPNLLANKLFSSLLSPLIADKDMLQVTSQGCTALIFTFMVLSLMGTAGIDVKPFLSLLSVSGLTLGFALKDILTNTFQGYYFLATKRIQRGWIISVAGHRGKVVGIDHRYLTLQDVRLGGGGGGETLIPVSQVFASAITIELK
jgi:small-conductance mechanosensitive channel